MTIHLACKTPVLNTSIVGWYASTSAEIGKIKTVFNKMFGMLPKILPENRIFVDEYLAGTWTILYELIAAVESRTVPDGIESRFTSYVDAEGKRLQANLNDIRYDIDELDALSLVTGPGRIERVSANILVIFNCYTLSSHSTSFQL